MKLNKALSSAVVIGLFLINGTLASSLRHLGSLNNEKKTTICHVPEDDPLAFHSITVANSALKAHLAHGDKSGPCDDFCAELCDLDDDPCTVVPGGTNNCELVGCPTLVSVLFPSYDFSGDGVVDDKDLILLIRSIADPLGLSPQASPKMDLNNDGIVDLQDADLLLQKLVLHYGKDSSFNFIPNYGDEGHNFDWTPDRNETQVLARSLVVQTCGVTEHDIYKKGVGPDPVTNWGPFNVVNRTATATWKDYYNWAVYKVKNEAAQAIGILEDATPFYQHFRDNVGTKKKFDLQNGYQEDQSIEANVDAEIMAAAAAARQLFNGVSSFTFHAKAARPSKAYPLTENWQKTIGGHVLWATGNVEFNAAECKLDLDLTITAEDYYDFNPGQVDLATGLPDSDNARFEVLGWAKGFPSSGTMVQTASISLDCCEVEDCSEPAPTGYYWQCTCNQCQAMECNASHCCSASDCLDNFDCVANVCVAMGNPRFMLSWTGDDDLDLHVITPGGAHIYYVRRHDPASGGTLDHDDIPQQVGTWVENIFFPMDGSAPSGTYQYYVHLFNMLGGTPDSWVLSAWVGDSKVNEVSGIGTSSPYTYTHTSGGSLFSP